MASLLGLLVRGVLLGLCGSILGLVAIARTVRGPRPMPPGKKRRVLLTGTFYNRGWLRGHARPVAAADRVETVVVVTDAPLDDLDHTVYSCPPAWLARLTSRAPARFLQLLWAGWRYDVDVFVGYHIMPNALLCLAAAALLGRRAVYQMTGGPAQVIGGGAEAENALQRRMGKDSPALEGLLMRLIGRFDAIVVRGAYAVSFLAARGLGGRTHVIPAGIDLERFRPAADGRRSDVVFVGRLDPVKGCDLLQEVLVELVRSRPETRVAVVGDGPLREAMTAAFAAAGVADRVEMAGRRDDVHLWLGRSRVFLLTSPDEGLSIALLEAMCAGAVPVVSDVGELRDVVQNGQSGYLVPSRRPADYVARLREVLDDPALLERLSARAREVAIAHAGLPAVSARWDALLDRLATAEGSGQRPPA